MTPEWEAELARLEIECKQAETRLENALRHLTEVHADQIERDRKLEPVLRSIAALLEGL